MLGVFWTVLSENAVHSVTKINSTHRCGEKAKLMKSYLALQHED